METIKSIVLTAAGDVMVPPYHSLGDAARLYGREGFVFAKIGEHSTRKQDIILYELTNCNVLICQELALRIEIPKSVDTYGKLRDWCARRIREEECHRRAVSNAISQTIVYGGTSDDD